MGHLMHGASLCLVGDREKRGRRRGASSHSLFRRAHPDRDQELVPRSPGGKQLILFERDLCANCFAYSHLWKSPASQFQR